MKRQRFHSIVDKLKPVPKLFVRLYCLGIRMYSYTPDPQKSIPNIATIKMSSKTKKKLFGPPLDTNPVIWPTDNRRRLLNYYFHKVSTWSEAQVLPKRYPQNPSLTQTSPRAPSDLQEMPQKRYNRFVHLYKNRVPEKKTCHPMRPTKGAEWQGWCSDHIACSYRSCLLVGRCYVKVPFTGAQYLMNIFK